MVQKILTVFHGTDRELCALRAGSWITLAEEEARDYASSADVMNVMLGKNRTGEKWLLTLEVREDEIEWRDGWGDDDFNGKHGILKVGKQVLYAIKIVE